MDGGATQSNDGEWPFEHGEIQQRHQVPCKHVSIQKSKLLYPYDLISRFVELTRGVRRWASTQNCGANDNDDEPSKRKECGAGEIKELCQLKLGQDAHVGNQYSPVTNKENTCDGNLSAPAHLEAAVEQQRTDLDAPNRGRVKDKTDTLSVKLGNDVLHGDGHLVLAEAYRG